MQQKILKPVLAFSLFVLVACGNPRNDTRPKADSDSPAAMKTSEPEVDLTVPAIPADYKKLSLAKIGLDASLMAPGKAGMQQSVLDDNEGKREEYLVSAFSVLSGDSLLDSMNGIPAMIEIYTTEWTLQQHKDRIKFSSISGWNKFLKEETDYCIYTTRPQNTSNQPLRANDKDVYQFLILQKSKKDNKTYCIRSSDSFDLTAEQLLKLFAIARTIEL